ncbi:hypothetical protein CONLIGDRAFT_669787 [Coniochaeta ligniaria NRRL 30616]|uniref:RRM domain-containing protein n=1 Tax=Coniochaeta ligniaria NRRL 30616 TaxID=1408157 RepID=A0A1J7JQK1_9PEZI|nr:hypothetical protein CONLIGDRAFT_669787 [Coniochaeta ligniaria NRRL 30616]
MTDAVTGQSRGYGFVRFSDETDQQRALVEMLGLFCGNRPMRISTATPKSRSHRWSPRPESRWMKAPERLAWSISLMKGSRRTRQYWENMQPSIFSKMNSSKITYHNNVIHPEAQGKPQDYTPLARGQTAAVDEGDITEHSIFHAKESDNVLRAATSSTTIDEHSNDNTVNVSSKDQDYVDAGITSWIKTLWMGEMEAWMDDNFINRILHVVAGDILFATKQLTRPTIVGAGAQPEVQGDHKGARVPRAGRAICDRRSPCSPVQSHSSGRSGKIMGFSSTKSPRYPCQTANISQGDLENTWKKQDLGRENGPTLDQKTKELRQEIQTIDGRDGGVDGRKLTQEDTQDCPRRADHYAQSPGTSLCDMSSMNSYDCDTHSVANRKKIGKLPIGGTGTARLRSSPARSPVS